MNRRKRIIQKLNKKYKQAQAKKQPKTKPPYIAKADREKTAIAETTESLNLVETADSIELPENSSEIAAKV